MVEPRDWPASAMESTPSLSSRSSAAPAEDHRLARLHAVLVIARRAVQGGSREIDVAHVQLVRPFLHELLDAVFGLVHVLLEGRLVCDRGQVAVDKEYGVAALLVALRRPIGDALAADGSGDEDAIGDGFAQRLRLAFRSQDGAGPIPLRGSMRRDGMAAQTAPARMIVWPSDRIALLLRGSPREPGATALEPS